MQELKLIVAESDTASLVLRGVGTGEEFFLPVTAELCNLLADANPAPAAEVAPGSENVSEEAGATAPALSSVVDAPTTGGSSANESEASSDRASASGADSATGSTHGAGPADAAESTSATESTDLFGSDSSATSELTSSPSSAAGGSDSSATAAAAASDDAGDASTEDSAAQADAEKSAENTTSTSTEIAVAGAGGVEKKRRHRIKINMSPRTIQDRVRHGASVAELAKEADTDEARIEPYAWPILQERARIADIAHAAHPVLADGPTKQTLWEVLATALAARGVTLSDATWDAYVDQSRRWLVSVEWEKEAAGQTSTHQAEFIYEKCTPGPDLVHANNSVASDLIDPRYGQPVRRMAAVTPLLGGQQTQDDDFSEYDQYNDQGDYSGPRGNARDTQEHGEQRGLDALIGGGTNGGQNSRNNHGGRSNGQQPRGLHDRPGGAEDDTNEFLLHPDNEERKPNKRKRKAVTPHWEDVLLGVRTNPRKKK